MNRRETFMDLLHGLYCKHCKSLTLLRDYMNGNYKLNYLSSSTYNTVKLQRLVSMRCHYISE